MILLNRSMWTSSRSCLLLVTYFMKLVFKIMIWFDNSSWLASGSVIVLLVSDTNRARLEIEFVFSGWSLIDDKKGVFLSMIF